jgi:hypothetical protein
LLVLEQRKQNKNKTNILKIEMLKLNTFKLFFKQAPRVCVMASARFYLR